MPTPLHCHLWCIFENFSNLRSKVISECPVSAITYVLYPPFNRVNRCKISSSHDFKIFWWTCCCDTPLAYKNESSSSQLYSPLLTVSGGIVLLGSAKSFKSVILIVPASISVSSSLVSNKGDFLCYGHS